MDDLVPYFLHRVDELGDGSAGEFAAFLHPLSPRSLQDKALAYDDKDFGSYRKMPACILKNIAFRSTTYRFDSSFLKDLASLFRANVEEPLVRLKLVAALHLAKCLKLGTYESEVGLILREAKIMAACDAPSYVRQFLDHYPDDRNRAEVRRAIGEVLELVGRDAAELEIQHPVPVVLWSVESGIAGLAGVGEVYVNVHKATSIYDAVSNECARHRNPDAAAIAENSVIVWLHALGIHELMHTIVRLLLKDFNASTPLRLTQAAKDAETDVESGRLVIQRLFGSPSRTVPYWHVVGYKNPELIKQLREYFDGGPWPDFSLDAEWCDLEGIDMVGGGGTYRTGQIYYA